MSGSPEFKLDGSEPIDPWPGVLKSLLEPDAFAEAVAKCKVPGRRFSRWDLSDEVEALAAVGRRYGPRKPKTAP